MGKALTSAELLKKEATIPDVESKKAIEKSIKMGLQCADSITDKTISCFSRGELPHYAGINTFLNMPYLEDVNKVGDYDVAVMGIPHDCGTTYRTGARFGPQGIRRASALFSSYSYEFGVDLREQIKMVDIGDVFTINANIEKSFDQITKAVSHVYSKGTLPIMLGGDHSIAFPCIRGIAQNVDGPVGIIHVDRHLDTQELDMDERMHTCPWFHATDLPNVPAVNLVQVGIGGWQVFREGVKVARERNTTVLTISEVEEMGIQKAAEMALEIAWKGAKAVYLSFDIDSVDCGFVPGTGWPEPGGFLPREVLKFLSIVAREGIAGMEVVEVAPCYDKSDVTSLLATRGVLDVLANLVDAGKIGRK